MQALLPKTSQTSKLGVALEEAGGSWDLAKLDAVEADVGCEHLLVERDVTVSRVSWSAPQTQRSLRLENERALRLHRHVTAIADTLA